jgi:hypothetical protein
LEKEFVNNIVKYSNQQFHASKDVGATSLYKALVAQTFLSASIDKVCRGSRRETSSSPRKKLLDGVVLVSVLLAALFLVVVSEPSYAQIGQPSIFQAFVPPLPPASIGDTVHVPVVIRALTPAARQRFISRVTFYFRFNPSVVYLLDTSLSQLAYYADNNMAVYVDRAVGRRLRAIEDTIVRIPILVTWGDAETSELNIGADTLVRAFTFDMFDSLGTQILPPIPVQNGILRVRDAAWGDSLLTLNPLTSPLGMTFGPNPVPANMVNFQLSIGNLQRQPFSTPKLVLYHITGENAGEVALDLSPPLVQLFRTRSTEMVTVPLNPPMGRRIPRGMYLCRFSYATHTISRLLMVQ